MTVYFTTLKEICDHSRCNHHFEGAPAIECERQRVMFQLVTMARHLDHLTDSRLITAAEDANDN